MKTPTPLVTALLVAAAASGHAFTLDLEGHEGAESAQSPQSIFVPGYGEVMFETGLGSTLVVNSAYLNDRRTDSPSPGFDPNKTVKITFKSTRPLIASDEVFLVQHGQSAHPALQVPPQDGDESAGVHAEAWNAIPEPAAATLGLIGTMLLIVHRRRCGPGFKIHGSAALSSDAVGKSL